MESPKKVISIVIVTYNSSQLIHECLQSIYDYNDIGDSLEIIVVDNNSKDITELNNILASDFPEVKLINNYHNGGYGQGNNVGIKESTGNYILIMNPDARFKEPILKKSIKLMRNKNLALLGMKQWVSNRKRGVSFRFDNYTMPSLLRILLTKIFNTLDIYIASKMYLVGACFFLDKDKFFAVDLFDERIFMYNEESDIRNRILNNYGSKSIYYCKDLNFIHLSDNRPFSFITDKRIIDSLIYYVKKYNLNIIKVLKSKRAEKKYLYYTNLIFKKKRIKEIQESINYISSIITIVR